MTERRRYSTNPLWNVWVPEVFQELSNYNVATKRSSYPPYNIVDLAEKGKLLEFAVAGFDRDEISISLNVDGILEITGNQDMSKDKHRRDYAYQGIACRNFSAKFTTKNLYKVDKAEFKDGILSVYLGYVEPKNTTTKIKIE